MFHHVLAAVAALVLPHASYNPPTAFTGGFIAGSTCYNETENVTYISFGDSHGHTVSWRQPGVMSNADVDAAENRFTDRYGHKEPRKSAYTFPDKVPALDSTPAAVEAAYGPMIAVREIKGGTANRVLTDDGTEAAWSAAPTTSGQYLGWNGSALGWYTPSGGGSGTVTSVAASFPSDFALSGSPITTSGTLAVTWQTEAANKFLSGPASGSAATPTWRAIVSGDLASGGTSSNWLRGDLSFQALPSLGSQAGSQTANTFLAAPNGSSGAPTFRAVVAPDLGSGTGSSSNFLRGDLTWAAPTAGAAGSTGQVQFNNGSGALTADGGLVDNGVATSGALLAVAPTNTAATGVKVTSPASFTGNYFEGKDSSGNDDFKVLNTSSGTTQAWILTQTTGSGIAPGLILGTTGYQTNGNWVGNINFGDMVSGTYTPAAQIYCPTAENHGASAFGTNMFFRNTAKGQTTGTNRVVFDSQGNIVTNASGSAVTTSATDGFLFAPNMAGVPTGTPTAYTGASATVYDTSDGTHFAYTGSVWTDASGGRVFAPSTTYVMKTTDKVIRCTNTSGFTTTLCSNSAYAGHVAYFVADGSTANMTIAAGSGDSISNNGSTGSITVGPTSATYAHYVQLLAIGTGKWLVIAGG